MKEIAIDDFQKLELKVGRVLAVEEIPGSERLLKLEIDIGEERPRQVLAGIRLNYQPVELKGRQVVVLANLKPRKMMGFESQAMILAADSDQGPVLIRPEKEVKEGVGLR